MTDAIRDLAEFFFKGGVFVDRLPDDGAIQGVLFSDFVDLQTILFENEDDVNVIRKGLAWVGRKGFANFGVRHFNDVTYLNGSKREVERIMKEWVDGDIPQEVVDLFEDSSEDQRKLKWFLGRATYRCNRNKGFGDELTSYMAGIRERIAKSWAERQKARKPGGVLHTLPESELVEIIKPFERKVAESFGERDMYEAVRTVNAMAAAARNIRVRYRWKGWNLRNLVREIDEDRLLMDTHKRGGDLILAAEILLFDEKRNEEGGFVSRYSFLSDPEESGHFFFRDHDFGKLFFEAMKQHGYGAYDGIYGKGSIYRVDGREKWQKERRGYVVSILRKHRPSESASMFESFNSFRYVAEVSPILFKTNEEGIQIGNMRFEEFLEGRKPYKNEARMIARMLEYNLNCLQFRDAVDLWAEKRHGRKIDWEEVDKEIRKDKEFGSLIDLSGKLISGDIPPTYFPAVLSYCIET